MTSRESLDELPAVEFTFGWYEQFLERLLDHGYDTVTFADVAARGAVAGGDDGPADVVVDGVAVDDGNLLVRHDVDLSPAKALAMGRIEAELGVQSTYFFLITSPLYNVFDAPTRNVLEELESLGHEVGVHFSTHQHWRSEPSAAELVGQVGAEQSVLASVVDDPCEAVSFHCPPEWVLDRRFEEFLSAYDPSFFSEITYWADSGQRWRSDRPLGGPLPDSVQLLAHPGLWGPTDATYTERVTSEVQTNLDRIERFAIRQLLHDRFDPLDYPVDYVIDPPVDRLGYDGRGDHVEIR